VSMRRSAPLPFVGVLLGVFLMGEVAEAQDKSPAKLRRLTFAERGNTLVMAGSFTDVFDEAGLRELSSGFVTTVLLRAYVYEVGKDMPIWYTAATYRVSYDMWDEVYDIRMIDPAGARDLRVKSRADALKIVTVLDAFPVAPLSAIKIGPHYFVGVIIEINPVSPALLAEVRRWLSRPQGDPGTATPSLFGSFVTIFVNPKIDEADRVLRVRSYPIFREKTPDKTPDKPPEKEKDKVK
jgi:hypothetical protein